LIKKTIIIILIFTSPIYPARSEIEISSCSISEVSPSEFILNYQIKNSFDADSYSSFKVILPFEKYIVQGSISDGMIQEKDFLFSQINLDLNKNGSLNDLYKAHISNKALLIDNKKINSITKTTSNYDVIIPFDNSKNFNTNKISNNGIPFTLRKISILPPEITIGFNDSGIIEFKTYDNSVIMIEVITPDKQNFLIDGETPFVGITNERDVTDGENFYRYAAVKKVPINTNSAKNGFKIGKISKPFSLRVTYFFSITENLILTNQKVLRVN